MGLIVVVWVLVVGEADEVCWVVGSTCEGCLAEMGECVAIIDYLGE